jgi:hypothetical protein
MPNEICVLCGKETNIDINTHIDYRYGYVEGSGQCCKECYDRTTDKQNYDNNKITEIMMHRTQLITVTGEEIIDTPNDSELGAKVRQKYWSYFNVQPNMKCSLCGQDTSDVDYDYLSGYDHISCILSSEMKS